MFPPNDTTLYLLFSLWDGFLFSSCLQQMSVVHGNLRIESCLFEDSDPWADVCIVDPGVRPHSFAQRGLRVSSNSSSTSTAFGSDTSSSTSSSRRKVIWKVDR